MTPQSHNPPRILNLGFTWMGKKSIYDFVNSTNYRFFISCHNFIEELFMHSAVFKPGEFYENSLVGVVLVS